MKTNLKINLFSQPMAFVSFITLLFVLLSVLHGISVRSVDVPSVDLSLLLIKSIGGLFFHSKILEVISWTLATLPLLLFIYRMIVQLNEYDQYILVRLQSRSKWWVGKFVSCALLSVVYGLWYIVIHVLVGSILFSFPFIYKINSVGAIARLHVPSITGRIDLMALFVFLTGLVALGAVALIAALLCKRTGSAYLLFTLFLFVSGVLYVNRLIPRELAPMMYPSFLDLFSYDFRYDRVVYALSLNASITLLCLVMGLIFTRSAAFAFRTN
ncbi:hypothetical protein ACFSO0_02385 [Brevibacillus sp. GCM10020057]|uniref:hypothetical protein n=1 Tax=Brevibacillus sp. GCM10020057 TaxID=3317327 RepID=UPI00363D6D8B